MQNYFNNVCEYLLKSIKAIIKSECLVVSEDGRNIQFVANNKTSETFNIYRITNPDDINIIIRKASMQLA